MQNCIVVLFCSLGSFEGMKEVDISQNAKVLFCSSMSQNLEFLPKNAHTGV